MAKILEEWLETEVQPLENKSVSWLSQFHFFRDPIRPSYSDLSYFFSPADGIIIYQKVVGGGLVSRIQFTATTPAPVVATEANSDRAIAFDSPTMVRDPFSLTNQFNLDRKR